MVSPQTLGHTIFGLLFSVVFVFSKHLRAKGTYKLSFAPKKKKQGNKCSSYCLLMTNQSFEYKNEIILEIIDYVDHDCFNFTFYI